jgi:hypothetical protein
MCGERKMKFNSNFNFSVENEIMQYVGPYVRLSE